MAQGTNNMQGGNAGQTGSGMPIRPGTAGATGIQQNRVGGPAGSSKGFQDRMGAGPYHQGNAQQISSKGFQQQHISQAANTSYMRNNMGGGLAAGGLHNQAPIPQQKRINDRMGQNK